MIRHILKLGNTRFIRNSDLDINLSPHNRLLGSINIIHWGMTGSTNSRAAIQGQWHGGRTELGKHKHANHHDGKKLRTTVSSLSSVENQSHGIIVQVPGHHVCSAV